jgi:hypothetical protein
MSKGFGLKVVAADQSAHFDLPATSRPKRSPLVNRSTAFLVVVVSPGHENLHKVDPHCFTNWGLPNLD